MDKIHIRNLLLRCVIGVFEKERHHRQDVRLNLVLHTDIQPAGVSDDLADTVDYVALRDHLAAVVESSSFHLIEALAEEIARICLADSLVRRVDVTVDKPGALTFAESVAVEITRVRAEAPV
ncbi:MAG: dihydroneopterin aldolase [Lentisphaeria bacterium]|nr:dihydroneopterin aldolase [Lentisphaeria bacterium]